MQPYPQAAMSFVMLLTQSRVCLVCKPTIPLSSSQFLPLGAPRLTEEVTYSSHIRPRQEGREGMGAHPQLTPQPGPVCLPSAHGDPPPVSITGLPITDFINSLQRSNPCSRSHSQGDAGFPHQLSKAPQRVFSGLAKTEHAELPLSGESSALNTHTHMQIHAHSPGLPRPLAQCGATTV